MCCTRTTDMIEENKGQNETLESRGENKQIITMICFTKNVGSTDNRRTNTHDYLLKALMWNCNVRKKGIRHI